MSITDRHATDAATEPLETEKGSKRPARAKKVRAAKVKTEKVKTVRVKPEKVRAAKVKTEKIKPEKTQRSKGQQPAPAPQKPSKAPKRNANALLIGGEPRIDLLPPEVRAERRGRRTRGLLGYAVLATVIVMVLVVGAGFAINVATQARLLSTQSQTVALLAQQQKFTEVHSMQNEVAIVQDAQRVGASTEIDWSPYLTEVQASLPATVTIQTVNVDSSSPLSLYAQSSDPTQKPRVATVSFTATTPILPDVPAWLRSLEKLPGYADGVAGTISLDPGTKAYTVNVTIHVNDKVFAKRFETKGK